MIVVCDEKRPLWYFQFTLVTELRCVRCRTTGGYDSANATHTTIAADSLRVRLLRPEAPGFSNASLLDIATCSTTRVVELYLCLMCNEKCNSIKIIDTAAL
jgi:hypothetical protein